MRASSMSECDVNTFEIGSTRQRLKPGIRFKLNGDERLSGVLVEDTHNQRFHRIGLPEYAFLSALDGKKSLEQVVALTASDLGDNAFTLSDAANLMYWAVTNQIAECDASVCYERLSERRREKQKAKWIQRLNPIAHKIHLCDIDPFASVLNFCFGWVFSKLGAAVWTATIFVGLFLLVQNFSAIYLERLQTLSSGDFLVFALVWLFLKVMHELGHAIACKRFGGDVPSLGLLFILFVPIPYVDVTSMWRVENRWQRIITSSAGILTELWLATVCMMAWMWLEPGSVRYHLETVILLATINSILFNANPLMRFDGYYVLADLLGITNLYQKGRQSVQSFAAWALFGTSFPPSAPSHLRSSPHESVIVPIYGILSLGWTALLSISMTLAAFSLLDGIGLILAVISALVWFGIPTLRAVRRSLREFKRSTSSLVRSAIAVALLAGLIHTGFRTIPSPSQFTAPIVIEFANQTIARANTPGLLSEVLVEEGMWVRQGELIARLTNPELRTELKILESEIASSTVLSNRYLQQNLIAKSQIETEKRNAMLAKREALLSQIAYLDVVATGDGYVIGSGLTSRIGTYLNRGDKILEIADTTQVRAIAMIGQNDSHWLRGKSESSGWIELDGRPGLPLHGSLTQSVFRSQDHVPHAALAAPFGGPLTVVNRASMEGTKSADFAPRTAMDTTLTLHGGLVEKSTTSASDFKLVSPRSQVELLIHTPQTHQLYPGQTGVVHFYERRQSLGNYLAAIAYQNFGGEIITTHGL